MPIAERSVEQRAAAPRVPEPTRALKRARAEHEEYRAQREQRLKRSLMRGLILLAVVVLVVSMARAGLERAFMPGWWRP